MQPAMPRYRSWVSKFYKGIQEMAPVSDQEINEHMTETSLVSAHHVTLHINLFKDFCVKYFAQHTDRVHLRANS